jgi:glycosyltransferase involved in cell wall biosynthesis
MSQSSTQYSIIIPAFNRADEIKELLTSIADLDFPKDKFEVIVSDDGSTDNTQQLVKSFQEGYDFNLRFISQENKGPGAARNHAMENAEGDFFIFVDSDVTMPSEWMYKIDHQLTSNKADAFGGPDSYRDDFSPLLKAINYSMTSFITTGGLRGKKGKKLARFYPRSFNMGLKKKLWRKIGGFGTLRHGQDIEFSHRIIKSGAKVSYIDAPVFHKRRTNIKRFYKQVFNWGVARINLYKLDNEMLEILHAAPALFTLFVLIILIFALFFKLFQYVLFAGLILGAIILIYSAFDSAIKYKSIKPAFWLPFVMPAQIFGYGSGFIYNYVRRVILNKGEKTGFKKNYYK